MSAASMPRSSRALARLDAAIAATRDPGEAGCLRAERAATLARLGRFDEATAELDALRRYHERNPRPALAAWLCLAEGVTALYRNQGADGRDRIRRAYALAVAARVRPLIALTAAWMAHIAYSYNEYAAIARHAAEALQEAAADQHSARARACLTIAQSYHWAGRLDRAQPWYERARAHALHEGDTATVAHLLRARAWLAGMHACMARFIDGVEAVARPDELRQALLAAESSAHFDDHLGGGSQRSMARITLARLVLAQDRHAEALTQLEDCLPLALADGMDYFAPVLHADMAWCRLQLGQPDAAQTEAAAAEAAFIPDCEGEDRACAHARLAQVYAAFGQPDRAESHAREAAELVRTLREDRAKLVTLLDEALARVHGEP